MSKVHKVPRPRNPHVAVMRLRPSGAHPKARKPERAADRVRLRKSHTDHLPNGRRGPFRRWPASSQRKVVPIRSPVRAMHAS